VIYEKVGDDIHQTIGECRGFMRLDRRRDASRNLNGIIHGEPTHAAFALFVEAFLMMTYESMRNRQDDEAEKYVQKAIGLDGSCAKAWEVKRVLAEKRKEYRVAADASRERWELSGQPWESDSDSRSIIKRQRAPWRLSRCRDQFSPNIQITRS
jgi:hypothetical protein